MPRLALVACLALLPVAAGLPALAQLPRHPPFTPARDASVVYDVQPDGAPSAQQITVSFSNGGQMIRIDSPDGQGATILDRRKKMMTVLVNQAKVFMQIPERSELRSPFLLDPGMQFAAIGPARVAGLDCMRWTITTPPAGPPASVPPGTASPGGTPGNNIACVTADGLVLSEEGADSEGARGHLVAQRVAYAPVPASTFQVPPGYAAVTHPEGPGPYARGQGQSGGLNTGAGQNGPMTGPGGQ